VVAYLEAENAYADAVWRPTLPLQGAYRRLSAGSGRPTTAPTLYKGWWNYVRTVEEPGLRVYCRRRAAMERRKKCCLMATSCQGRYADLHCTSSAARMDVAGVSGHSTALSATNWGPRPATGEDLGDVIRGVYYGSAWSADSAFYVMPDAAMAVPSGAVLGTPPGRRAGVQEDDERFELSVRPTKRTVRRSHQRDRSPARDPLPARRQARAQPRASEAGRHVEYSIDHRADRFLISPTWGSQFQSDGSARVQPGALRLDESFPNVRVCSSTTPRLRGACRARPAIRWAQRHRGARLLDRQSSVVDQPDSAPPPFGFRPNYDSDVMRFFYTSLWPFRPSATICGRVSEPIVKGRPVRGGGGRAD
jgi:hypothetical protein